MEITYQTPLHQFLKSIGYVYIEELTQCEDYEFDPNSTLEDLLKIPNAKLFIQIYFCMVELDKASYEVITEKLIRIFIRSFLSSYVYRSCIPEHPTNESKVIIRKERVSSILGNKLSNTINNQLATSNFYSIGDLVMGSRITPLIQYYNGIIYDHEYWGKKYEESIQYLTIDHLVKIMVDFIEDLNVAIIEYSSHSFTEALTELSTEVKGLSDDARKASLVDFYLSMDKVKNLNDENYHHKLYPLIKYLGDGFNDL